MTTHNIWRFKCNFFVFFFVFSYKNLFGKKRDEMEKENESKKLMNNRIGCKLDLYSISQCRCSIIHTHTHTLWHHVQFNLTKWNLLSINIIHTHTHPYGIQTHCLVQFDWEWIIKAKKPANSKLIKKFFFFCSNW